MSENTNFHQTLNSYQWKGDKPWNDYASFLKHKFGGKIQKISIDAGFTCPNRDGTKSRKGCTYCNNASFSPAYCKPEKSIVDQIEEGCRFFGRKYSGMQFLAYFQTFSNTYASLDILKSTYEEALDHPKIAGIILGTRPDCIGDDVLKLLKTLSERKYVAVEIGVESTNDQTLERINRHHSFEEARSMILKMHHFGIDAGVHLILGLPGETNSDYLDHADIISKLPVHSLKLHQLQILNGTHIARQYRLHPEQYQLFEIDAYIDLVIEFLLRLNPSIMLDRFVSQSPSDLLIAPKWNVKNFEFVHKLQKKMKELDVFQGMNYIHY